MKGTAVGIGTFSVSSFKQSIIYETYNLVLAFELHANESY